MKKSLSLLLVLAMLVSLFVGLGVPALAEDDEPMVGAISQATVLTVNLQAEGDVAVPIKSYNISELAALSEINDDGAAYIYYKKDAANAVVATEYVTLSALLAETDPRHPRFLASEAELLGIDAPLRPYQPFATTRSFVYSIISMPSASRILPASNVRTSFKSMMKLPSVTKHIVCKIGFIS